MGSNQRRLSQRAKSYFRAGQPAARVVALPAGLGDIATGIAAPFVARQLARGTGRAALWLNAFGLTDLVVAITLDGLAGFQLIHTTPSGALISTLPLALIPTAAVPLLFARHITSVSALKKARRAPLPATPTTAPAGPRRTARRPDSGSGPGKRRLPAA